MQMFRTMALGDSTTKGAFDNSSFGNTGGYRAPLLAQLADAGVGIQYVGGQNTDNPPDANGNPRTDLAHQGIGGRTTAGILADIQTGAILLSYPADVILLMIGANDPHNGISAAQSGANLSGILGSVFQQVPQSRVIIKGISSGSQYQAQYAPYNQAQAAAAVSFGGGHPVNYLPATAIPDAWIPDGIHRSPQGYNLDAADWLAWLLRVLQA